MDGRFWTPRSQEMQMTCAHPNRDAIKEDRKSNGILRMPVRIERP